MILSFLKLLQFLLQRIKHFFRSNLNCAAMIDGAFSILFMNRILKLKDLKKVKKKSFKNGQTQTAPLKLIIFAFMFT